MDRAIRRSLSVLVDNEAGVLSQVSRLFSRKGYNIESLAVGTTDDPAVSRITIEVLADDKQINLLSNQLRKLFPVHSVKLLNSENAIRRELILIKVNVPTSDCKHLPRFDHRCFRNHAHPCHDRRGKQGHGHRKPGKRVWHPRAGANRHDRAGTRYGYNL